MSAPTSSSDASHEMHDEPSRNLPAAARRALDEAAARRAAGAKKPSQAAAEIGGRGGQDPVRYGDWEIKGRAVDF